MKDWVAPMRDALHPNISLGMALRDGCSRGILHRAPPPTGGCNLKYLILAIFLTGCASQRELELQAIKDNVDSSMTYVYCKGWDCPANCAAYAKAYQARAGGDLLACQLPDGEYHAFNRTEDGYIMDNRKQWVHKGWGCQ